MTDTDATQMSPQALIVYKWMADEFSFSAQIDGHERSPSSIAAWLG
jgi:hypothetical protein